MRVKTKGNSTGVQHRLGVGSGEIIHAYFGDEIQTDMGGLPLLGELERVEGLVSGAAKVLREWRVPGQISLSLTQILLQRVFLICAGYEDGIDSEFFATDAGLKMAISIALGKDVKRLCSQSTISRFENDIGPLNLYRLAVYLVLRYIASKKKAPKNIRLDFDGSCVATRGEQQGSAYRKYYDTKMYFPLFVFDQDGYLITAVLRPGSDGEANMTVPILKRLVRAFRQAWPKVQITVVMDSGFTSPKTYDWCEDNNVYYLIKLKAAGGKGGNLFADCKKLARKAKIAFGKKYGQPKYLNSKTTKCSLETQIRQLPKNKDRMKKLRELNRVVSRYGEFQHRTGLGGKDKKQWRQDRRVLAVCRYDDWGNHRSFFVTNITSLPPEYLIECVYSKRGEAELFIKDAKTFRCDKLSCCEFFANQCRLLLHVLANQLMYKLRSLLPTALQSMTLASVRDKFIRIPAIVRKKARTTDLIWSNDFPAKNQMHALITRLTERQSFRTNLNSQCLFLPPILQALARPHPRAA